MNISKWQFLADDIYQSMYLFGIKNTNVIYLQSLIIKFLTKMGLFFPNSPFFPSLAFLLTLLTNVFSYYLFISLNVRLNLRGNDYSILGMSFDFNFPDSNFFAFNLSVLLNQTNYAVQSSSPFDLLFINATKPQALQLVNCFQQNYNYIADKYNNIQPCSQQLKLVIHRTCNMRPLINGGVNSNVTTHLQIYQQQLNLSVNMNSGNYTMIIDNSFYPCRNGSFVPALAIFQGNKLTIQENPALKGMLKIIFILLLQLMLVSISGTCIASAKYQKLKKNLEETQIEQEVDNLSKIHGSNK